MTRRERDTALLLATLADAPFAQPKNWTSELVRKSAVRGEVPANRIACPACNGDGVRRVRTVVQPCERCRGLGYEYGDLMIEERWRRRLGTVSTRGERRVKVVPCDACGGSKLGNGRPCRYCRGSGVAELALETWQANRSTMMVEIRQPAGDALIASMEARVRAGSYDELARALEQLRRKWRSLWRLTVERYVLLNDVGSLERMAYEGGLRFLTARMPEPIRVPASARGRTAA